MVVAVVLVRVVQAPVDEVVSVIVVRDGLVPAAGTVDVTGGIVVGGVGVPVGMFAVDCDGVLVEVVVVRMMEVPVVQVVDVPVVSHGGVPAAGTMLMVVLLVDRVFAHGQDGTRSAPEGPNKCEREALSLLTLRSRPAGCAPSTRMHVARSSRRRMGPAKSRSGRRDRSCETAAVGVRRREEAGLINETGSHYV